MTLFLLKGNTDGPLIPGFQIQVRIYIGTNERRFMIRFPLMGRYEWTSYPWISYSRLFYILVQMPSRLVYPGLYLFGTHP